MHLSVPKLGGQVDQDGWKKYDCYELSKSGDTDKCVARPITMNRVTVHPRSGTGSELPTWYRTWKKNEQKATGTTVENRYILSMVRGDNSDFGWREPLIELRFGTKKNDKLEIDDRNIGPCSGGGDYSSYGTGTPHPIVGDPRTLLTDIRQAPFYTWIPDIRDTDELPDEGVSIFVVTEFNDSTKESEFDGMSQFIFGVEEPIPFGAKGRFKAGIGGQRISDTSVAQFLNIGDEPSGYIEVIRFDEEVLHVKLGGNYCIFTLENPDCSGNHTVAAEMIRPFGWTYDRAQRPVAVFTPGMEEYARQVEAIMGGFVTGLPIGNPTGSPGAPGTGTATSGSASSSSGGAQACQCTCEEYEALEKMAEKFDDSALDDLEGTPEEYVALMEDDTFTMLMACSMTCMQQYSMCEVPEDR